MILSIDKIEPERKMIPYVAYRQAMLIVSFPVFDIFPTANIDWSKEV
jgi:hypothetical protein